VSLGNPDAALRHLLHGHLNDKKDAGGQHVQWSDNVTRRMDFSVQAGPVTMRVQAIFRNARNQQYILHHPQWYGGRRPLARLCVCDEHDRPHWHHFEGPGEPGDTRDVQRDVSDGDLADLGFLLVEVFARRLHIERLVYEGRLIDG
jgi:hypothetical protein